MHDHLGENTQIYGIIKFMKTNHQFWIMLFHFRL